MDLLNDIEADFLEDCLSVRGKSVYFQRQGKHVLALRTVSIGENQLQSSGRVFIFDDDKVFELVNKTHVPVLDLPEFTETMAQEFKRMRLILDGFLDEVDRLEDSLFGGRTPIHFINSWFRLKKDISMIDRAATRNLYVYRLYLGKLPQEHSLIEPTQQVMSILEVDRRTCSAETSRLEALFNYYNSLKSDRMNYTLYLLAIVSGVFLPLNLLVGFFGMNTENLFFKGDPQGTMMVVYLLGALFLLLTLGLPFLRFFTSAVLSRIFGRYNIYQSSLRQLASMGKRILP